MSEILPTSASSGIPNDLSFLERPIDELIDVPVHDMPAEQVRLMLAEINELTQKPGALVRAMEEEAVALKAGTKRKPRTARKTSIEDLF